MSHTPGPWEAAPDGHASYVIRHRTPDLLSSHIARLNDHWLCDEHGGSIDANAKLLSSAPELLQALEALLAYANAYSDKLREVGYGAEQLGEGADSESVAAQARRAIAKAKGVTT